MLQLLRIVALYLGVLALYTGTFVLCLRSRLLEELPLFFQGVAFIVLVALAGLVLGALILRLADGPLRLESVFAAIAVAASLNFSFFVVVPVTIDRSVTTFLLASMNRPGQAEAGLTEAELTAILERDYLTRFNAVGRRMEEQIVSGNIRRIEGERYVLTEQGREFLAFANWIAAIYRIPPRYIQAAAEG